MLFGLGHNGAEDQNRTGTIPKDRRILSPVRLPVPPPRQLSPSTTVLMAPRVGFEPTTYRLTAGCSTVELPRNVLFGSVLLSQGVTTQVPSALRGLTSVFGMVTGVPLSPSPPNIHWFDLPSICSKSIHKWGKAFL